jgi:hypothetical protein
MEKITFNHDGVQIHESFNLSEKIGNKLDSIIIFETIVADRILEVEYEGVREDAPREIKTKTGVLARCMKYATNDQEIVYLAYAFVNKHNATLSALAGYEAFTKIGDPNGALHQEMIRAAKDHFGDKFSPDQLQEKLEDMIGSKTRPFKPMKKLIRQIDNSNYDYSLFKAMLDEEDGDVDAYIPEVVEDMIEHIKKMRSGIDED